MRVFNKTQKTVICERTELAKSYWQKTKGLMFRKSLPRNKGLLMVFGNERRTGIWMFGMRFPIDIVFIDSRKRVVDVKKGIKPFSVNPKTWRVFYPSKSAKYILELNKGESQGLRNGDLLSF